MRRRLPAILWTAAIVVLVLVVLWPTIRAWIVRDLTEEARAQNPLPSILRDIFNALPESWRGRA